MQRLQEVFDKSVEEDRHIGRVGVDVVVLGNVCDETVHSGGALGLRELPFPELETAIFVS